MKPIKQALLQRQKLNKRRAKLHQWKRLQHKLSQKANLWYQNNQLLKPVPQPSLNLSQQLSQSSTQNQQFTKTTKRHSARSQTSQPKETQNRYKVWVQVVLNLKRHLTTNNLRSFQTMNLLICRRRKNMSCLIKYLQNRRNALNMRSNKIFEKK